MTDQKNKISEMFEGEKSSLRKTYDNAVSQEKPKIKIVRKYLEEFEEKFAGRERYSINTYHEFAKDFISQMAEEICETNINQIEAFITDEILICYHENTPTSRLTSLMMKVKDLKNKILGR